MNLVNARLFGEVDLTPAPLLSELPDSSSNLDADIGVHSSSIDLVEALDLVDALSRSNRAGDELPCRFRAVGAAGGAHRQRYGSGKASLHAEDLRNCETEEHAPTECHALVKKG